jgi:hypothetical protein
MQERVIHTYFGETIAEMEVSILEYLAVVLQE